MSTARREVLCPVHVCGARTVHEHDNWDSLPGFSWMGPAPKLMDLPGCWSDIGAAISSTGIRGLAAPALLERHGVQAPLAPSAAMALPLLGFAGMALDYMRASQVQTKLQVDRKSVV